MRLKVRLKMRLKVRFKARFSRCGLKRGLRRGLTMRFGCLALACAAILLGFAVSAEAARVRVLLPDGASMEGEWLGSSADHFQLRLDDGSTRQLAFAGGAVVMWTAGEGVRQPRPEAVLRLRAGLDALDLGMRSIAEANFREAVLLSPGYADAHYALAQFLDAEEVSSSWDHYVWAARLNPERYPLGGKVRAVVDGHLSVGDYFSAGRECARFASSFGSDPLAQEYAYLAGEYLLTASSDPDIGGIALREAASAYEFALSRFPERPEAARARTRLGEVYVASREPEKAIQTLSPLLSDGSAGPAALLTLGNAHLLKGETDAAMRFAQRALEASDAEEPVRQEAQLLLSEVAWKALTKADGLPSDDVYSLSVDGGGGLLVGTSKGAARIDLRAESVDAGWSALLEEAGLSGAVVRSAAADGDEVWIGTSGGGIFRLNRKTGEIRSYVRLDGLASNRVDAIAIGGGAVWAGGLEGVSRFDRALETWRSFTSETSPAFKSGDQVTCLALGEDFLWAGVEGRGVYRYALSGAGGWTAYSFSSGFPRGVSVRSLSLGEDWLTAVWEGPADKGYADWDAASGRWGSVASGGGPGSARGAVAADGTFWMAANGALISRDAQLRWGKGRVPYSRLLDGCEVRAAVAVGQTIWLGTSKGLARVDASQFALPAAEGEGGGE